MQLNHPVCFASVTVTVIVVVVSSQEEPCPEGLCALTAMAILQKDVTLIKAAVVELRKASIRGQSTLLWKLMPSSQSCSMPCYPDGLKPCHGVITGG